jgi:voltage-gated potassium channel
MTQTKNTKDDISSFSPWRKKLHEVIFEYHTFAGKAFDLALLVAIAISVLVVMLESVPRVRNHFGEELIIIEWFFTAIFSLEYIARLISSPRPFKYMFSFMGLIDFFSIIPTYLRFFNIGSHSISVIRSVRLVRIFRILKLTRYMSGANSLSESLWNSRHKIIVFLGSVMIIVVIMGTILYLIEGGENGFTSIPVSIYWAIVTLTTVGYGDISPQTTVGQFVASLIMVLGYAILAVPTGIVTAEVIKTERKKGLKSCKRCKTKSLTVDANYCYKCGESLAE